MRLIVHHSPQPVFLHHALLLPILRFKPERYIFLPLEDGAGFANSLVLQLGRCLLIDFALLVLNIFLHEAVFFGELSNRFLLLNRLYFSVSETLGILLVECLGQGRQLL